MLFYNKFRIFDITNDSQTNMSLKHPRYEGSAVCLVCSAKIPFMKPCMKLQNSVILHSMFHHYAFTPLFVFVCIVYTSRSCRLFLVN